MNRERSQTEVTADAIRSSSSIEQVPCRRSWIQDVGGCASAVSFPVARDTFDPPFAMVRLHLASRKALRDKRLVTIAVNMVVAFGLLRTTIGAWYPGSRVGRAQG